MADAVLIIIAIVMSIVMLALSVYLMIVYIHPDDKGWGTALYCKILVVFGIFLCWAQALLLPLDVANNYGGQNIGGLNMITLWYIVYIAIIIMVVLLIPYAIFFYETDEDKSYLSRYCTALIYELVAVGISCILLFVSWNFFQYVDLPVTTVTASISSAQTSSSNSIITSNSLNSTTNSTTITLTASLVVYIMAILSFFGWIFLILFGGVGLFALPLDMMRQFIRRPKPRKRAQVQKTRQKIKQQAQKLAKSCIELKQQQQKYAKNSEDGWFSKQMKKRQLNTKLNAVQAKFTEIEENFQVFRIQLDYLASNPFLPFAKLLLGVIFLITAILWMLQLIFGYLARNPVVSSQPFIPFLNQLFNYMQNNNAGFIATFLYAYFILYLVWSVQKGNIKFGIRIPFLFKFHPMKQNGTWMNSFLFNIILLLTASVGITQLATSCFPSYSRNTQIYNMFGIQINYMRFYTYIYRHEIFPIALVIWTGLALTYLSLTFCCCKKSKQEQYITKKRKEKEEEL